MRADELTRGRAEHGENQQHKRQEQDLIDKPRPTENLLAERAVVVRARQPRQLKTDRHADAEDDGHEQYADQAAHRPGGQKELHQLASGSVTAADDY